MILTAGVLCCNQKCDFCHQSKIKEELFTIITSCPCPGGGQDNRVSVLSSWDDILHRYSNLSNFPEKIHVICFDVYMAPDRSLFGSWAGKKITVKSCNNIEQLEFLLVLSKLSKFMRKGC